MADRLLDAGFDEEEIHTMAVTNTRRLAGAVGMSRRVLVIGAHSADFVWRAGGAVAVAVEHGGTAEVVALSYGERGESGELWKQEGQTVENVKSIRHDEAEAAADGARRELPLPGPRRLPAADRRRRAGRPSPTRSATSRPTCSSPTPTATRSTPITRSPRSRSIAPAALAAGAGVQSAFDTIAPPALFLFEPHQPELCNFTPTTFVDITPVFERKQAAMARDEGAELPADLLRPARRAARQPRAARVGQRRPSRYAEAFQRVIPQVVSEL